MQEISQETLFTKFGIKGDSDNPEINRLLGIELAPDGFERHFQGLLEDPSDPALRQELATLRTSSENPNTRKLRGELAANVKAMLAAQGAPQPAEIDLRNSADTIKPEEFLYASKPVLIFGGLGKFWEKQETNVSNLSCEN